MLKNHEEQEGGERYRAIEEFLVFAQAELGFGKESLQKYRTCLEQLQRQLPDIPLEGIRRPEFLRIKARFVDQGLSESWLSTTLLILRRFLVYCRDERGLEVLDPDSVTPPKRKKREVIYLTNDEIDRFIGTIKLKTAQGEPYVAGLRFRAMVEMLLGSALRISELLSLNRGQIDPETRETKIVGKGNQERTAFFTRRAILWLDQYLAVRSDEQNALFVDLQGRSRLKRADVWRFFARHRKLAGIDKRLTAHILRHTAATQLLFNGCPMGHIKEILGHARLETTCRYYLGVDHRAAKKAHEKYLVYAEPE